MESAQSVKLVARILCNGGNVEAVKKEGVEYLGPQSSAVKSIVAGGDKMCLYGCLGGSDCVDACQFGAIFMNENGLPVVVEELCTGCGQCVEACPRGVIEVHPEDRELFVFCKNQDDPKRSKEVCNVACFGCGICARKSDGSIVMKSFLPEINYENLDVAGTLTVALRTESLPYYFQALAPSTITVPGTSEVRVALQLPIGRNKPSLYLGLGDSLTYGDGSSDGQGYKRRLQDLLGAHFGLAEVATWGRQGDTSAETEEVTTKTLGWFNPAYTLILLGTNDWHDHSCQSRPPASCYTLDSLRAIVRDVKDRDSLPVLGTIPPVNPARAPASRNTWYDQMNAGIKALGQQEQVLVADLNAEMRTASNLSALFDDDVHPNDAGYQLLAQAWFKAITRGRASATSAGAPSFGFRP